MTISHISLDRESYHFGDSWKSLKVSKPTLIRLRYADVSHLNQDLKWILNMNSKPSFNLSHKSSIQYRLHRKFRRGFSHFVLLLWIRRNRIVFPFRVSKWLQKLRSRTQFNPWNRAFARKINKLCIVRLTQLDKKRVGNLHQHNKIYEWMWNVHMNTTA